MIAEDKMMQRLSHTTLFMHEDEETADTRTLLGLFTRGNNASGALTPEEAALGCARIMDRQEIKITGGFDD